MINKELFKKMGVETACLKFAFGKSCTLANTINNL